MSPPTHIYIPTFRCPHFDSDLAHVLALNTQISLKTKEYSTIKSDAEAFAHRNQFTWEKFAAGTLFQFVSAMDGGRARGCSFLLQKGGVLLLFDVVWLNTSHAAP